MAEKFEPTLNHIGISCSSEAEYQATIAFLQSLGLVGDIRTAPDHQRIFFSIPANTELELQLWNPEEGIAARNFRAHFDVIAADPMETLNQYGPAQDWGVGEIPRGGVKISDHLMVMARPVIK